MSVDLRNQSGRPFGVQQGRQDGIGILDVRGEVDLLVAPAFSRELAAAALQARGVVLNLCEVEYIDSSGIAVIVRQQQRLADRGARLAISCVPDGAARQVFSITALDRVLQLYDTRDAAVAAVS